MINGINILFFVVIANALAIGWLAWRLFAVLFKPSHWLYSNGINTPFLGGSEQQKIDTVLWLKNCLAKIYLFVVVVGLTILHLKSHMHQNCSIVSIHSVCFSHSSSFLFWMSHHEQTKYISLVVVWLMCLINNVWYKLFFDCFVFVSAILRSFIRCILFFLFYVWTQRGFRRFDLINWRSGGCFIGRFDPAFTVLITVRIFRLRDFNCNASCQYRCNIMECGRTFFLFLLNFFHFSQIDT